jgi:predicted ester cyclase
MTSSTLTSGPVAVALQALSVMERGTLAEFEAVIHPEATNREAVDEPPECRGRGPAAFHATMLWLNDAFAELRWEVHDVIADGDLVAIHCTMSGRHVRPFVAWNPDATVADAFPPTGKRFAVTQSHWIRVADGMLIEHWANRDDLGMAKQLGWVPPSPRYLLRMARAKRAARRAHAARPA